MTHVYVVMGATGEYSDHREWPVIAYANEADAQAHVLRCDAWLREHRCHMDDSARVSYWDEPKLTNPHDPLFDLDYTGSRYYVLTVPWESLQSADAVDPDAGTSTDGPRALKGSDPSI